MAPSNRGVNISIGVLTTILVGWVLHIGANILQPLVIALLVAAMLAPVVTGLARFKVPPTLTVVTLAALLFVGLARVGVLIQDNIAAFLGEQRPVPTQPIDPFSEEASLVSEEALPLDQLKQSFIKELEESKLPDTLKTYLTDAVQESNLGGIIGGAIGSGVDFIRGLFLVVLYMVFIFAEAAIFKRKILSVAGERRQDASEILGTIARGIQRYLGVKTVASFCTGAICYAMLVALDVPYALLWAFLTFLLNYIPTFGSIVASFFPMATAFAGGELMDVVLVAVGYLTVNTLIGSYLEPKILGRQLNLSPLVVVVSVVAWAGLWGIVGTFLAVPLTATLQIVLNGTVTTRPIAVLLSSGPPREERPLRVRARKRSKTG